MIQATIKMSFSPEKIDETLNILRSIVERTRAEAGCISCSVYLDTEDKSAVVFEEKWRSNDDLQRYLRSEDYQKVLLVMEMANRKPDVRFDTITVSSGVEIIEKARIKNRNTNEKYIFNKGEK
jgi:quinol monooxygenase YgiN